jgi:hypothetical protein
MALLRKDQLSKIVQDEEMLATPLLVLCIDAFGTDFFNWEPATFDLECAAHFGVQMPDVNRDKVWALVTVLSTDLFYKSLESFIPIANSLSGSEADFDDYDPVTGEEAAWAIAEANIIDPPEEKDDPAERFSHDIRRYIGETLKAEGVTTPPPGLAPYVEYDNDPEEQVGISAGPDPDFVAMHETRQADERAEIERFVDENRKLLRRQLKSLPLTNGSLAQLPPLAQAPAA